MMMIGTDPDRGEEATTPTSDTSTSDIVGTPGVDSSTWEEEPGRLKGPGEKIFEAALEGSTSAWRQEPEETSASDVSTPDAQLMKLNLRASLMGVHILDDETEMFFSRQVSNASNAATVPFTWEVEPGRPSQSRPEPRMMPLTPPSRSRPMSGILYPGQVGNAGAQYYGASPSGSGPEAQGGLPYSEKLLRGTQYETRRKGEGSSETLDRHFGHYSSDMRYDPDNETGSPTSTLDHADTTESSPSTESERLYPSRNPNVSRYLDGKGATSRPSSQLAQCLLSLTAMADDTTDDDDIIFEQPSTSGPLWHTPPERPPETPPRPADTPPRMDWSIVQFEAPTVSKPQHRHPKSSSNSKNGRTIERWSSNSNSWNLSLLAKPKATMTNVPVSGSSSSSKPKRHSKRHSSSIPAGVTLREIHNGASSSTVLTYDRSGDAHGRHKWERDSSSSLPSAEEVGFEAFDRPGDQMVQTMDEEDFPFSPVASSFVFGDHNSSLEFSQRGGRSGIPRAVGPIVHDFASSSNFELHDFQETMSTASEGSHTYSLDSGFLQPELDWLPTSSFHYIKGPTVEIVELGPSNATVINGYIEINHSGRFSIDLQRGPRLERHLSSRYNIEKTPDVLLRIVEEAHSMSARRRSNATKYECLSNCRCLPVPKKGLLGRCLTSNHRVTVANSFESRLRSRSLGSVNAKHHSGPFYSKHQSGPLHSKHQSGPLQSKHQSGPC